MLLAFALGSVAWNSAQSATPGQAQPRGDIHGRVLDSSGGSIPGVIVGAVRVEPVARPIVRSAQTSEKGEFTLRDLPRGRYFVVAGVNGFTQASAAIDLSGRHSDLLALVLRVAAICECMGGPFSIKNQEGQGIPGARLQKEAADGTLTSWGRVDGAGQSEWSVVGGDVFVIDAPGYGGLLNRGGHSPHGCHRG
jgi:hypothetical protein